MSHDADRLRLHIRYELRKYDGDPPGPGEDKAPVEVCIIEDSLTVAEAIAAGLLPADGRPAD